VTEPDSRTVCVFTGSRADYGPSIPVLRALRSNRDIDLRILASGGHLLPQQGLTASEIESDGFHIDERVDAVLAGDTPTATAKSFGLACIGYADAIRRLDPDILVVLGDRYEALAAAVVGLQHGTVVAHIGGGQLTYGSLDNQMRNAISKLAHLHFVTSSQDADQLANMGEPIDRIFELGPITFDSKLLSELLDKDKLEAELGLELESPTFVVTYHPATSDESSSRSGVENLLTALDRHPNARVVITSPNLDSGGASIASLLRTYATERPDRVVFTESLGRLRYLSLMKHADAVVGNSSSGILEAPLVGTPTVNIGSRQEGRTRADSVIDCDESVESIAAGLARSLESRATHDGLPSLADADAAVSKLVGVLRDIDLTAARHKR